MSAEPALREILAALEFRRATSALCSGCRRIDESDLETLERLASERAQLVRLLDQLDVRRSRGGSFDWQFKEWPGPVGALRAHLGMPEDEPSGWREQVAARERAEGADGHEYAERMSVLWAEEAMRRKKAGR